MKNKTMFKLLFLSILLSSCGLIERFKTPEQPTDSKDSSSASIQESTDDLFSKTMEESNNSLTQTDNPANIAVNDEDLKSLEDEFSSSGPGETIKESTQDAPIIVEETLPEIQTETPTYSEAGEIKTYKVKKGETLMQIAFKIYGDISKWKEIKSLNSSKLSNNSSLMANTELKYRAPATPFVWNPSGVPYLIKHGETLGTISNSVYATPKKWKSIWENNKPLIKNPNVIFAGFTLYYKNGDMANYVQPKSPEVVEEIVVEKSTQVQNKEVSNQEVLVDEAIESLSAPQREIVEKTINAPEEAEIDLINNVSVPQQNEEIAPDIDEEIQTL